MSEGRGKRVVVLPPAAGQTTKRATPASAAKGKENPSSIVIAGNLFGKGTPLQLFHFFFLTSIPPLLLNL